MWRYYQDEKIVKTDFTILGLTPVTGVPKSSSESCRSPVHVGRQAPTCISKGLENRRNELVIPVAPQMWRHYQNAKFVKTNSTILGLTLVTGVTKLQRKLAAHLFILAVKHQPAFQKAWKIAEMN